MATMKTPQNTLRIKDLKDRAASIHRSELIAWRGGKAHKTFVGSEATGSPQVLPGGLARKCPVDIFAEAAISKEYLSAEDRSRESEWASLGMLSVRMWAKLPAPKDLCDSTNEAIPKSLQSLG
ncbi:hypothetical protein DP73_01610 [Desulfosporosinus sp. HMP52]|nr:hypothetical protein DP73_01610 [Desulfosporosinus sp. HMP52]